VPEISNLKSVLKKPQFKTRAFNIVSRSEMAQNEDGNTKLKRGVSFVNLK
jgi:hypothetical protein